MFDYGVQSALLKLQQKTMAFDGWLKIAMTAEAAASAVATYHFQHIYLIKLHEKRKSTAYNARCRCAQWKIEPEAK